MTNQVEDFTGKGIQDLQNGVIRTPMDPGKTFDDDPLRILRTFRFASRFDYKMVPEIMENVKKPAILVIILLFYSNLIYIVFIVKLIFQYPKIFFPHF